MTFKAFIHPYKFNAKYKKSVAYFSMEFAIDQALKIYSGGLGYLAGSHMRSAYELKQNVIGIGILWKYGYYDQTRKSDQTMDVLFQEKIYNYLEDTGIIFQIEIDRHPVHVKAYYLRPEIFNSAPVFLLTTDIPENDYLARTTSHKLYDVDTSARISQNLLLGIGGVRLLEILKHEPDIYHFNEAHALPAAFELLKKFNYDKAELKKRLIFTTHTPEAAGNEKHDIHQLEKMSFFGGIPLTKVRELCGIEGDEFDHTLAALRLAKHANGVSKLHGEVARKMWSEYDNICEIDHITNAQNYNYWADKKLYQALKENDDEALKSRKKELKTELFQLVADQTGKILDPDVLTIIWARRFAGYKRPDLLLDDLDQLHELLTDSAKPIQIIWAGKPYPFDFGAIEKFNKLVHFAKNYPNTAVVTGYEMRVSKLLKQGADIWLNTPRITREASGTSGMTAAMNGAVNFSTNDGWMPEFAIHGINSFIIPPLSHDLPLSIQDSQDLENLIKILKFEILEPYYNDDSDKWLHIVKNSMTDVLPFFDSGRMADEYYEKLYNRK